MKTRRALIHAEVLALERDFDALWLRFPEHTPDRTRADLVVLQRGLDAGALQLDTDRDRRALGIALGMVAAHELGLEWIRLGDEWGVEWALADRAAEILAHPLPMIANRADDGRSIELAALFDSIASLYTTAPQPPNGALLPWRAEFTKRGPGVEELEARLGALAAALQAGADLSFVLIRGAGFTISVDAGRGNANDMTMQVSFAGDRAMLVVGGGRAQDPSHEGAALHQRTREQIAKLLEEHLGAHPEAAEELAPLSSETAQDTATAAG